MTTILMHNGNNLIIPSSDKIELNNGLRMSEQRGKKSMMWGRCINGKYAGHNVLYPVYAADDITGKFADDNTEGIYHIVKDEDIVMTTEETSI